jgi:hypothetical protein
VDPFSVLKTLLKREMMAARRLHKRSETWRQGMDYPYVLNYCWPRISAQVIMDREERREHRIYLSLQRLLELEGEDLTNSSAAVQRHIIELVSIASALVLRVPHCTGA